jgi:hypothetical protein
MGHGSSDAVLDLLKVTSNGLDYRLGAKLRSATEPVPDSAPTRVFQVQIAAPPPSRTDGSDWFAGLRVEDGTENGRPFDPTDPSWMQTAVFALQGISPLGQPDAATLVFDEPLSVDRVTDATAADASFTLIGSGERVIDGVNHFMSLHYPMLRSPDTGREVRDVAATFYRKGRFDFDPPVSGFVALSLDGFAPVARSSVEYIFFVP